MMRLANIFRRGAALASDPAHNSEVTAMPKDTKDGDEPQDFLTTPVSDHAFEKHLRWMISNPPKEAMKVVLTPVMAEIILRQNTFNRPLKKSRVAKLVREMDAGHWVWTGQPIIISADGTLLDGQHRLTAVVQSGVSIPITLLFGVPKAAFDKIDQGDKRGTADIFAIRGEENYAPLAAATRIVWRYENTGMMTRPELEPESAELWVFMNDNHPNLRRFMTRVGLFQEAGWGAPSMFAALNYLCAQKSAKAAEDFFYQLATGNDIGSRSKGHPINRLRSMLQSDIRERALGRGTSPLVKAAYTVKAWNAWRSGNETGLIRWRGERSPDEPFPRIK